MSGFLKNVYAFVNLGMAGFVMATVAVRFVFPAVSAEGRVVLDHPDGADLAARFPVVEVLDRRSCRCWLLTEVLTIAANEFLGVDPFLKVVAALAIVVHELRAGRARDRPRRALSAVRRRRRARWPDRTAASRS